MRNPQAERLGIGGYCSFPTTTKVSHINGLSDYGAWPPISLVSEATRRGLKWITDTTGIHCDRRQRATPATA